MTPTELLAYARGQAVEFVDLRYRDGGRHWQHVTLALEQVDERSLGAGVACEEPDRAATVRLRPALETAFIDPFCQHPTLALVCDPVDAETGADLELAPRAVARRAAAYLTSTGVADKSLWLAELRFFVFDQASFEQTMSGAHYRVDSRDGAWQRGRAEPDNLGLQPGVGEAARRLPPADSLHNLRAEMAAALAECRVPVRGHSRPPATGGQAQIDLTAAELVRAGDTLLIAKYVIRNVAARHGKVATFMPYPLFGEAGGRLGVHLSLDRQGQMVLGRAGEGGLSDAGRWAVGGLWRHTAGLLALTSPTTNAFRRPPAADEAAAPAGRRADWVGWRRADLTCDPYLALSALLMAALDGIAESAEPGGLEDGPAGGAGRAASRQRPATLEAALQALEGDQAYLLKGGVFSKRLIEAWLRGRRDEAAAVAVRPHPQEFCLYFGL